MGILSATIFPLIINLKHPEMLAKRWTPIILKNNLFWLDYIMNTYVGINAVFMIIVDAIFIGFLIHGITQLDILKLRIKDFTSYTRSKSGKKLNYQESIDYEKKGLNRIIQHHQAVLK